MYLGASPQFPGAAPFTRSYWRHMAKRYGAGPYSRPAPGLIGV
jgi:hypothetical protein